MPEGLDDGLVFSSAGGNPLTKSIAGHIVDNIEDTISGAPIVLTGDPAGLGWLWRDDRYPTQAAAEKARRDVIEKTDGRISNSTQPLRHYLGASLIGGGAAVAGVSQGLGHSSPEVTWCGYSYLMTADQAIGRAALTKTLPKVVPHVHRRCNDGKPGAE